MSRALTPTLSRRHARGAESTRGLLFTVLGEFVLPTGGTAWTSAFIDVLGRLGVEEKASRQALMRTAADGWLDARRHGRRTAWALSPNGERLLTEGTERIFGFRGTQCDWDGRWLLVLARAPESERAVRHRLRTRLTWAGFGSPAPGVWISTHPDRAAEAERVLAEVGVLDDAQIFRAERHGGGPLSAMVRQAWDLAAVEASYAEFLAEFAGPPIAGPPIADLPAVDRPVPDPPTTDLQVTDPLVRIARLVHAWRRFPLIDPALPAELLPDHWSGARAADLFGRLHGEWHAAAIAEWRRISAPAP